MLTRKQLELLLFINERVKEDGVPPSFEEMKEALNLQSKSGIHRLILALEERGFLRFIEAAACDAVRDCAAICIESRKERRVVTFDESIERARQIGEAFGVVKIVPGELLDGEFHFFRM